MSYCRPSDGSDVYVFPTGGGIECCGCHISVGGRYLASNASEMIDHLVVHEIKGDHVPEHAFDRLRDEAARDYG